jgi:hypothetical protein
VESGWFQFTGIETSRFLIAVIPRNTRRSLDDYCRSSSSAAIMLRAPAGWQSGHAAACKAVYAGSIPTPASIPHYENGTPTCLATALPASAGQSPTKIAKTLLHVDPNFITITTTI